MRKISRIHFHRYGGSEVCYESRSVVSCSMRVPARDFAVGGSRLLQRTPFATGEWLVVASCPSSVDQSEFRRIRWPERSVVGFEAQIPEALRWLNVQVVWPAKGRDDSFANDGRGMGYRPQKAKLHFRCWSSMGTTSHGRVAELPPTKANCLCKFRSAMWHDESFVNHGRGTVSPRFTPRPTRCRIGAGLGTFGVRHDESFVSHFDELADHRSAGRLLARRQSVT